MNILTSDEQRGFDIAIGRVLAGLAGRYDAAVMLGNTARAEAFEDVADDVRDWAAIPLVETSAADLAIEAANAALSNASDFLTRQLSGPRKGTYRTVTEHVDGTTTDESGVA